MADIVTDLMGYFRSIPPNETTLVSEIDDPPKHRMGVKRLFQSWGRSLGAHSFNFVRESGIEEEVVLLQGKIDDRSPLEHLGGEYRWDIKKPGDASDAGMIGVMNAFHDKIDFHVPISAPNLMGGAIVNNGRVYSSNKQYCWNFQNDGHQVQYKIHDLEDETTWKPVWSSWYGLLKPLPW
jgi:hypothetical protein